MTENKKCPHCEKSLGFVEGASTDLLKDFPLEALVGYIVLNKMGHNWHVHCWEKFQSEYNDVLDSTDVNNDSKKEK